MDGQFKILVVDDDPINLKIVTAALKDDYEVINALNGKEAIAQIKKHKPDLVVMDVMMPGLSGFDVSILIKSYESFSNTPIIFMTASDNSEKKLSGLELGGIDYLFKPVDFTRLRELVRNHIALKEAPAILNRSKA